MSPFSSSVSSARFAASESKFSFAWLGPPGQMAREIGDRAQVRVGQDDPRQPSEGRHARRLTARGLRVPEGLVLARQDGADHRVVGLMRLQQPQEPERSVQDADICVAGDDDRPSPGHVRRADDQTFVTGTFEILVKPQSGDDRRALRRPREDDPISRDVARERDLGAEQAAKTARELLAYDSCRG